MTDDARGITNDPVIATKIRVDLSDLTKGLNSAGLAIAQATKKWSGAFRDVGATVTKTSREVTGGLTTIQNASNRVATQVRQDFDRIKTGANGIGADIAGEFAPLQTVLGQFRTSARLAGNELKKLGSSGGALKTLQNFGKLKPIRISVDIATFRKTINSTTGLINKNVRGWGTAFTRVLAPIERTINAIVKLLNTLEARFAAVTETIVTSMSRIGLSTNMIGSTISSNLVPVRAELGQLATSARRAKSEINNLGNAGKQLKSLRNVRPITVTHAAPAQVRRGGGRNYGGDFDLDTIRGALAGTAAGALGAIGLRAADDIRLLRVRYEELEGSQEKAAQTMDLVAKAAKRVGAPIRSTQQAFLGLIPSVRDAGENVEEYMGLALRLATMNPAEGLEGAIFSIREALTSGGTDLVSLSERFNIPRTALRALTQETGSFSKALDMTLNRYGATQKAAEANARSLTNLSAVLFDTFQRKLESGFSPSLEAAASILSNLNKVLEWMPSSVITLGTTFVVAIGAMSAMRVILGQLAAGYNSLTASIVRANAAQVSFNQGTGGFRSTGRAMGASAVSGLGMAVSYLTVTAGSIFFGAQLGLAIGNTIGKAIGDENMANATMDSVITTAKQLIFIIADVTYQLAGRFLVRPLLMLKHTFDNVGLAFNNIVGSMQVAVGGLVTGFAELIVELDRKTKGVFGIGGIAENLSGIGERLTLSGQAKQTEYQHNVDDLVDAEMAFYEDFLVPASMKRLGDILRLIPKEVDEASMKLRDATNKFKMNLAGKIIPEIENFFKHFDTRLGFAQELEELSEKGDPESILDRLDAMEREERLIREMLPALRTQLNSLERFKDASEESAKLYDEMAAKLAGYHERLEVLTDQIPALIGILDKRMDAALSNMRGERDKAALDIEADRIGRIKDVNEKAADDRVKQADDVRKKELEVADKEKEDQAKFHKAIEDAETEHRKRILKIYRDFLRDAILAASRLDAAGVAAAIAKRQEELAGSGDQLKKDKENANEQLAESARQRQKELEQLRSSNSEKLVELENARNKEIAKINEAANKELSDLNLKLDLEIQALRAAYNTQLADLQRFVGMTTTLRQQEAALIVNSASAANLAVNTLGQTLAGLANYISGSMFGNNMGTMVPVNHAAMQAPKAPVYGPPQPANQVKWENMFNINGSQDPQATADAVGRELVRLAQGAAGKKTSVPAGRSGAPSASARPAQWSDY